MESGIGWTVACTVLPVLVWIAASVDALRRPPGEFTVRGMSRRRWTGALLLSMLVALGPLAAVGLLPGRLPPAAPPPGPVWLVSAACV